MNILKRKLALILIGFTAGVFLYQYSLLFTLLIFPITLISLFFLKKRGLHLIIAVIFFFAGGLYTSYTENINLRKTKFLTENEQTLSGTVISIPENESYGQSAICKTEFGKIRLMTSDEILKYKDEVTFTAKCYYPEEKSRPFAFDYPLYLKSEGIYLSAFAENIDVNQNSIKISNPIDAITLLSNSLLEKADKIWSGESLMFARAILLGDTSYSTPEFREKLSSGSISHIIAVSGTHVSFVSSLFIFLTALFSARRRYLRLLAIPFILFFVLLTGASPSAIRAAIMMIFYILAQSTLSHYDGITSLSVAAFLILLPNPFAAFSLSYILSFSAVGGILLFAKPLENLLSFINSKYVRAALAVTLSAQIFTFPTVSLSFGKFPFLSLFANLLVVPLVPLIMTFGYLALSTAFIHPSFNIFSVLCNSLINLCLKISEVTSKLPLSNIYLSFQNEYLLYFSFFLFFLFSIMFLLYKKKKLGVIIFNLFLAISLLSYSYPLINGSSSVHFADANHGDCTISFNKNHSIMIDCYSPDSAFLKSTVLPLIRQNGFSVLDVLALTEYNEYEENVTELIKTFKVNTIILPEGSGSALLFSIAKANGTKIIFADHGDSIALGNMKLSVPYGTDGFCSYILSNENTNILIPGNITAAKEKILSEYVSECDILKAPRHANKGSCSETLLKKTNPSAVIVSTGRAVSEDFSKRLSEYDIYSTNLHGDIIVNCEENFEIIPYKKVIK